MDEFDVRQLPGYSAMLERIRASVLAKAAASMVEVDVVDVVAQEVDGDSDGSGCEVESGASSACSVGDVSEVSALSECESLDVEYLSPRSFLPGDYLDEMVAVGKGGETLDGCFQRLVDVADSQVGTACASQFAVPDVFPDVERFGAGAIVHVEQLQGLVGDVAYRGMPKRGCFVPISEFLVGYAYGKALGQARGARLVVSTDFVGVELVPDSGCTPGFTILKLLEYFEALKRRVTSGVGDAFCSCGGDVEFPGWETVMRGVSVSRSGFAGGYEFVASGGVRMHAKDCSARGDTGSSYVFPVDTLRASLRPAFGRWLHERAQLCCNWSCVCRRQGVREVSDGSWLVTAHFLCRGGLVRGFSQFGEGVLKFGGFEVSHVADGYIWYVYDEGSASVAVDSLGTGNGNEFLKGLCCGLKCGEARVLTLANWFQFLEQGTVRLVDVLSSVAYARNGVGCDGSFCDYGPHGARGNRLRQVLLCACGEDHFK